MPKLCLAQHTHTHAPQHTFATGPGRDPADKPFTYNLDKGTRHTSLSHWTAKNAAQEHLLLVTCSGEVVADQTQ